MALVFNSKTYNANSFLGNVVSYLGALHTVSIKDILRMAATAAKASVTFSGVGRTEAKLTRTLALTGALTSTGDAIITISVSVPVGFAGADVDSLLNDTGALVSSASFKEHVKTGKTNF